MANALEITRDIVIAAFNTSNCTYFSLDKETGKSTSDFIEAVYNKIKELENQNR